MSKWLITLTNNTWTEYNSLDARKTFSAYNEIVEFKGDLPTEEEISNLTEFIDYYGNTKYLTIMMMQKLQEDEE